MAAYFYYAINQGHIVCMSIDLAERSTMRHACKAPGVDHGVLVFCADWKGFLLTDTSMWLRQAATGRGAALALG